MKTKELPKSIGVLVLFALVIGACAAPAPTAVPAAAAPEATAAPAAAEAPSDPGKERTIYFASLNPEGSEFWAKIRRGAEDAAKITGWTVVWSGAPEFNTEIVINRMETAMATNPDVMVVSLLDPAAMEPVARRAAQQGIILININTDTGLADPPYLMYIGSDEYISGRSAGEAVLRAGSTPPKRAACAIHSLGHVGLNNRCRGFTDVLKEKGTIVDKLDVSGGSTEAEQKVKSYLTAHGTEVEAFYTAGCNPNVFDPALKVFRDEKVTGRIRFVTADTCLVAFDAIEKGEVIAAIDQQPYLQGYLPVIYADLYFRYKMLPGGNRKVLTGPYPIYKEQVPEVRALVEQKYR